MSNQPFNTAQHPRTGDGTFTAAGHSDAVPNLVVPIGEQSELASEDLIASHAVSGSPALSEATRQVHHGRRQCFTVSIRQNLLLPSSRFRSHSGGYRSSRPGGLQCS